MRSVKKRCLSSRLSYHDLPFSAVRHLFQGIHILFNYLLMANEQVDMLHDIEAEDEASEDESSETEGPPLKT